MGHGGTSFEETSKRKAITKKKLIKHWPGLSKQDMGHQWDINGTWWDKLRRDKQTQSNHKEKVNKTLAWIVKTGHGTSMGHQ